MNTLELFDHMIDQHDLTLTYYERIDIIRICEKIIESEKLTKCCLCNGNPCQCKKPITNGKSRY